MMNKLILFFGICFLFLVTISIQSQVVDQPSSATIHTGKKADPCVIVIFGATGDLTARKLLPAIYNLAYSGYLSEHVCVVGVARGSNTNETFREKMHHALEQFSRTKSEGSSFWKDFEKRLFYIQSDFDHDQGYEALHKLLSQLDLEFGTKGNHLYYLATQPSYFPTIVEKLDANNLLTKNSPEKWTRVIVEKPFGHDLESAIALQKRITEHIEGNQLYLIDHYLAKEGVQNLFTLRFENALFEPLWNHHYIDNVQITLSEYIGVGSRTRLWEETGSLRDLFQNHLLQLLAIIAMEPPSELNAERIHAEKIRVLNAIRPFSLSDMDKTIIRGQYGPGVIQNKSVLGYKQEKDVPSDSQADTFMAAKILIDNERWKGTPFYIRGGKRLPIQTTEIVVTFKSVDEHMPNQLFIRIQPKAGVFFKLLSKVPGLTRNVEPVTFGYMLDSHFAVFSPEAYEKLIYDCIHGDNSLFVRPEEVLSAWRLLDPVISYWKQQPFKHFPNYEAGTWGPVEAEQMLKNDGRQWLLLEN